MCINEWRDGWQVQCEHNRRPQMKGDELAAEFSTAFTVFAFSFGFSDARRFKM